MLICERFPGLTPLQTNEYRADEFFKLVKRMNDYTERNKEERDERETYERKADKKKKSNMIKITD